MSQDRMDSPIEDWEKLGEYKEVNYCNILVLIDLVGE